MALKQIASNLVARNAFITLHFCGLEVIPRSQRARVKLSAGFCSSSPSSFWRTYRTIASSCLVQLSEAASNLWLTAPASIFKARNCRRGPGSSTALWPCLHGDASFSATSTWRDRPRLGRGRGMGRGRAHGACVQNSSFQPPSTTDRSRRLALRATPS